VSTTFASASLFPTLGAQPAIGRAFLPEEDRPGADYRQVVISHGLWQRRFGADTGIIGQKVSLDAEDYTVVGVMPPGFKFPFQSDAWAPIERWANRKNRGSRGFSVIARLKPGVSIEQARSGMRTVTERLERDYPKTNAGVSVELTPQRDSQVSHLRPYLWLLLGAVFCVLLIACANVANLLLARAAGRVSEVAIRAAIGATRLRLARQLLTENLLLSLLGGALGLGLAWCSLRLLAAAIPVETPFWVKIDIDTRAIIFTLAMTLCASLLFGLAPAWRSSKIDLHGSLKEGGRQATGGERRGAGGLLVIAEMALALALLLGAGLMIKSFWRLQQVDPGFNPENLLTIHVSVPYDKYPDLARTSSFYDRIIERLKRLPGVEAVGGVTALPLAGREDDERGRVTFEGQSQAEQERNPYATWLQTSPEYFRSMSIPLINGRFFAESDGLNMPNVVILNRSAAHRFWPDENPIGKRLKFGGHDSPSPWWTVVGVVGDVSYGGLEGRAGFEIYAPYTQMIAGVLTFVMRSRTEPMSLVSAASNEIWTVDKDQALFRIVTMERLMADSIWQRRLWAMLLGAFAATAMALASVGIYGVMSHAVSRRRHEIGVRLALGARPADVLKMTIVEGLRLTMAGIAVGAVSAMILARALASLFYGVSATDPLIFLGLPALLAAVALLASYIPARRAAKVDPMTSLRSE
jgi:putative ABC transport system permease protein